MTTQREKIIKATREILENSPKGIRYADLIRSISEALPDTKINTIHGTIWEFKQKIDKGEIKDVARPEKGLYILRKYLKEKEFGTTEYEEEETEIKEEDFYKLFAHYLVNDLEECTKAVSLGGNRFQDRWGTPDVIGTYRILGIGHIQPPIEVISAEIKTDINQLITSFGQACSYKLFSHKVYLVIPKDARGIDIKRIESLCLKFGIGLILFDRTNKENPEFEILTRAVKSEPDYFYLNKYLRLIEDVASELF
ncbi:MAG: hypothetical protein BWY03_00471 [Parcubacteria group bacterium ADurb.Bin159]|jgi:hypothetical protein|nr:MAG: hypothetical protein BWY03_00471 [Parcubacteria group bacterium ADurb.Bin159]